jgi:hypothetical protein
VRAGKIAFRLLNAEIAARIIHAIRP